MLNFTRFALLHQASCTSSYFGQSTPGVSLQASKSAWKWPSSNAARVFEGFLENPTPPLFKTSCEPTGNTLNSEIFFTLHWISLPATFLLRYSF
jgi:hypothetical protein